MPRVSMAATFLSLQSLILLVVLDPCWLSQVLPLERSLFDRWIPQWDQNPERQAVSGAAEGGSLACQMMGSK